MADEPNKPKSKTWIWIVAAVLAVGIIGFVAVVGVSLMFVARQVRTEPASAESAKRAFAAARARFAGQEPIVQIDSAGDIVRTRITREPPAEASGAPLESMHVMVWDPKEGRIVRVALPFWLLRLSNRGSIHFSSDRTHLSFEHLQLTVDDLEKYGPALIVDQEMPSGERVLIWTQ
jgi:hypothetical protein